MKILNLLLAAAALCLLLLFAYAADTPEASNVPNPVKMNQEQFARIQPALYAGTSK
jgi:hypothetical protein